MYQRVTRMASANKRNLADELLEALTDERVRGSFKKIFEEVVEDIVNKKLGNIIQDVTAIKEQGEILKRKINELERLSKRSSLIIQGIKSSTYSEAGGAGANGTEAPSAMSTDTVIDFCSAALGIQLQREDIVSTFRLPAKKTEDGTALQPKLIVNFAKVDTKEKIYAARRKLKDVEDYKGIYINENLTELDAKLFQLTRKYVRDHRLHASWTLNGQIYLKATNQATCKAKKINCLKDLTVQTV